MSNQKVILGHGHRHRHPFCDVTYWEGSFACSHNEAWTHCRIEKRATSFTGLEIRNTDAGISLRDDVLDLLASAFELGREDAKQEIRNVLGVPNV